MPSHRGSTSQHGTVIVFDGDSRTIGSGGAGPYTSVTMTSLAPGRVLTGRNLGVSGQTVASMSGDAAAQIDGLLRLYEKGVCVIWGGYNDHATDAVSAATIESRIWTYSDARRTAGWKMVVCSELPANNTGWQAVRDTLNTGIVANYATHADALVNLGADATMGPWAARDDTSLYLDKTHPTDAGYAIIAALVATGIASVL